MAKGMSWLKINSKLTFSDDEDSTVASLIIDGCNMGVKSLNKYINQYPTAKCEVCDIAEKLISVENTLANDLKIYL